MKRFSRALLLALGLAVLFNAPPATRADELPLEKSSTGSWTVDYAGQHFRITSTAPVTVRFELISATQIKLTFGALGGSSGRVNVYWVEFQKSIYNGPIPAPEPWEGTLNTEGGFVDR